jgi:hypothetical protein
MDFSVMLKREGRANGSKENPALQLEWFCKGITSHSTGRSDSISFMIIPAMKVECHSPRAGQFRR